MSWLIGAGVWTLGCVTLAWLQVWRARRSTGPARRWPEGRLAGATVTERAASLARLVPCAWARELDAGVAEADGAQEITAAAEHALSTAERELLLGLPWPRLALWMVLAGVFLAMAGAMISRIWWLPAPISGVGALGALGCLWGARAACRGVAQARGRIDRLVEIVLGDLYHQPVDLPRRRQMRWQRRHRKQR